MPLTSPQHLLAAAFRAIAAPIRSAGINRPFRRVRIPGIAVILALALAAACGGDGAAPAAPPVAVDEAEIRRIVSEVTADVPTTAEMEFQIADAIGRLAAPPTTGEIETLIADAIAGALADLEPPPTDDEFRRMIADAVSAALPPKVVEHSAAISAANSLIAQVSVSLSREARVFVEYDNPRAGRFRTALSAPGMEHDIPVARLLPGSEYTYIVGIQDADGAVTTGASGEFATGQLPPEIAALETNVSGRSTQPLILADYGIGANSYYVFRDEVGNIVWYYAAETMDGADDGGDYTGGIRRKADGNLVYLSNQCCITEITPLGEVVSRIDSGADAGIPHDDFVIMDDGRILYPSDTYIEFDDSANDGYANAQAVVDTMRVWDPAAGSVEQVWDSRDFWDISDPAERVIWQPDPVFRWTDINSVSIGPRGNLVLSVNNRRQVISLSPDFQSIEWQLGGPGSDYDFQDPGNRFYGLHTASELANGNVLVFDNGVERSVYEGGEYSRALELRLDRDSGSVTKAWEYRFDPDIVSDGVSGAARLDNGNTLVNFGATANPALIPLTLVEADTLGSEVFRVEIFQPDNESGFIRSFRADGDIGAIMGETMLRPPAARPGADRGVSADGQYWPADDIEARLTGLQLAASEVFDVYLDGDVVAYRKEQCSASDTEAKFFLHVVPVDQADLPAGREGSTFDNLDFWFEQRGALWDGKCLAMAALPEYPFTVIRTGQFISEEAKLWDVEIPLEHLPRIKELELRLDAGRFVAAGLYEVYLSGNRMILFKASCETADTEAKFLVHVFPVDRADLPAHREGWTFDNLDFDFQDQGVRQGSRCLAMVTLPDYPINWVRTGQFTRETGRIWEVRFTLGR